MTSEIMSERIARCRLVGSACVVAAVIIDPMQPSVNLWGPIAQPSDPDLLVAAVVHAVYSIGIFILLRGWPAEQARISSLATWLDVLFAGALAFVSEGKSILFYPFFTFAILEAGLQGGMRRPLMVACASMLLWLALIVVLVPDTLMLFVTRALYLLIVGYLVGYMGEQRRQLELEINLRSVAAQREHIARELHDGYLQVLAAANLQLESCRHQLRSGQHAAVEGELGELQCAINTEHDEMRFYIRALAAVGPPRRADDPGPDTRFSVRVNIEGSGVLLDNILSILREGITNIRRHSSARAATVTVDGNGTELTIAIDDDGRGFGEASQMPWSIASHVRELGGVLRVLRGAGPGAHLHISIPHG